MSCEKCGCVAPEAPHRVSIEAVEGPNFMTVNLSGTILDAQEIRQAVLRLKRHRGDDLGLA